MKEQFTYNREIQEVISGKFLNVMFPTVIIALFFSLASGLVQEIPVKRLIISLGILAFTLIAIVLRFFVSNRTTALFFLVTTCLFEVAGVVMNGGFHAPAFTGLLIVIALVGWFYSSSTTIIYTIGYLIFGVVIAILNNNHLLPTPELASDLVYLTNYMAFALILFVGVVVPNRQLHRSLHESMEQERKLSESLENNRQSEENLRQTLDLFPLPVTITDALGDVLLHNRSFSKQFGYTIEDLPNVQTWVETVYATPEYAQEMLATWMRDTSEAVATGTTSRTSIHNIIAKDGTSRVVEAYMQPIGETYVNIFNDITERIREEKEKKRLTEQLHQSQKLEAIGQLAGGVAHDFNNALCGIIGAAELLKSGELTEEEHTSFIDLILTASDSAGELTKKLLLFSRKGRKANATIDCAKVVEEAASILKHTINRNITVLVENRSQCSTIIGDDSLLQNALMNMGINSSHAMPDGGVLTFSLENLSLDEEYCEVSLFEIKPGEYLELAVQDTGCGMPHEVMSHIFEPFFTTKEAGKGTGLGMSAVYGTVKEHDGAITVYSEVGRGTIFRIYLPVTANVVVNKVESTEIVRGSGTILVIDDEELIRITASALLLNLGYKVICAENGLEGVNTFREISDEIDLVILDMIMPVMGGKDAFLKLREIDPRIPVVIASGFAKEEELAELRARGINGFLHKPFRRIELAEKVAAVIRTH